MSRKEYVICEKSDLVAVADVVREKTGSTDDITVSGLANAVRSAEVNLDAEITEQENIIDLIQAALEGKAAGDGGVTVPELCTINFDYIFEYGAAFELSESEFNITYVTIVDDALTTVTENRPGTIQCLPAPICIQFVAGGYNGGHVTLIDQLDDEGNYSPNIEFSEYSTEAFFGLVNGDCHVTFHYTIF